MNIGDKIRIVSIYGEPNSNYKNQIGTITKIETDPWGDMRYGGTWGSIYIYPHIDIIERVD